MIVKHFYYLQIYTLFKERAVQKLYGKPFGGSTATSLPLITGRVMFETTSLPIGWVGKINEVLDEVWVPNVFNKAVLLREGVTKPILVIYEGISNSLPLVYCHEYKKIQKKHN